MLKTFLLTYLLVVLLYSGSTKCSTFRSIDQTEVDEPSESQTLGDQITTTTNYPGILDEKEVTGCQEKCTDKNAQCFKEDSSGKEECRCQRNFAFSSGLCLECICPENETCYFDEDNIPACNCNEGFLRSPQEGLCEECRCGKNQKCSLENETKSCTCAEGYSWNGTQCQECLCEKHEECSFSKGEKVCSCKKGYLKRNNICDDCGCDIELNEECYFSDIDKTDCRCQKGFVQLFGFVCEPCSCPENETCHFNDGSTECECVDGFVKVENMCEEITTFSTSNEEYRTSTETDDSLTTHVFFSTAISDTIHTTTVSDAIRTTTVSDTARTTTEIDESRATINSTTASTASSEDDISQTATDNGDASTTSRGKPSIPTVTGNILSTTAAGPYTSTTRGDHTTTYKGDPCTKNPCQNEATCAAQSDSDYTCACPKEWRGKNCDILTDLCAEHPCKFNGTCTQENAYYKCECTQPYVGRHCEKVSCDPNPCLVGSCTVIGESEYVCRCNDTDGYGCSRDLSSAGADSNTLSIALGCGAGSAIVILAIIFSGLKIRRRRNRRNTDYYIQDTESSSQASSTCDMRIPEPREIPNIL